MQTKDCRMRFKSPFSVISRRVLLVLIRKPLGIKRQQNEYYLARAVSIFIIRIVQRMQTSFFVIVEYFDAWLRNEDKDFKVVGRHGGYLLEELHFFS